MPRYFFHFQDGLSRLEDREGIKLPDSEAAWYQGVRSARDVIEVERKSGAVRRDCLVQVVDEDGDQIWAVPFDEVLELTI
jgi:hypothetical protein